MINPPLIQIHHAHIKVMGQSILMDLDFKWEHGQQWAVVGDSGKSLTAFLETILGRTQLSSGKIERAFAKDYQEAQQAKGEVFSFRDLMAFVGQSYPFRNKSNLQNFYFQQRFNSMESEEALTVTEYLAEAEGKRPGYWQLEQVLDLFKLKDLKSKSLIKLSNGETRRLALAAAMMRNPKILLLDQPMTGLDRQTRAVFGEMLSEIIAQGTHVMMSTRAGEIPSCITHIVEISGPQIKQALPKSEFRPHDSTKMESFTFSQKDIASLFPDIPHPDAETLIDLRNVQVQYGAKEILKDLNWQVKAGERWAIKGENGAGKSTLLSLILGENPQAYANEIYLFGRKRGSGESIWDIKKPIGFVAPELVRYFPSNQTCFKVVLSGFFDSMGLFRKTTEEQEAKAIAWLKFLGIEKQKDLPIRQVPLESQRFVLLARALIKNPVLLILDEAAQGMDETQRKRFRKLLDVICQYSSISMVYVSHYEEDIPEAVDKILFLKNGRRIEQ